MEGGNSRIVGGRPRSAGPKANVRVDAADEGLVLDLDRAIHVGLIVNELITNALKHAFPRGQPRDVTVGMTAVGEQVQLQVRDRGRGLPPGLDLGQAKSLGLRIVHILARRLHATVEVENHGGTCFTLTFPLEADAPMEPKDERLRG